MLKAFKSSSKVIPTENKLIKVVYNECKCYKCDGVNLLPVTEGGGSIAQCLDCSIEVILFDYISIEEYKRKIIFNQSSKKDTFGNFIYSSKDKNLFASFC